MSNKVKHEIEGLEAYLDVLIIQQMRLYDLTIAMLTEMNPEKAQRLIELHAQGEYFCPPPAYSQPKEEE